MKLGRRPNNTNNKAVFKLTNGSPRLDENPSVYQEKLKSFAFKTLMSAMRNNYHEIVPEYALGKLEPIHSELLLFIRKVLTTLPQIKTYKQVPSRGGDVNLDRKQMCRKAKVFDLFGFYSYNKEFRRRVFTENVFSVPLLLLLDHYDSLKSKFKDDFLKIFKEFKESYPPGEITSTKDELLNIEIEVLTCLKFGEPFTVKEESRPLMLDSWTRQKVKVPLPAPSVTSVTAQHGGSPSVWARPSDDKKRSDSDVDSVKAPASSKQVVLYLQKKKLSLFLETHKINDITMKHKFESYLKEGDLTKLFNDLVYSFEVPISVPKLNACFELYLVLLKFKHSQPLQSRRFTFTQEFVQEMERDANGHLDHSEVATEVSDYLEGLQQGFYPSSDWSYSHPVDEHDIGNMSSVSCVESIEEFQVPHDYQDLEYIHSLTNSRTQSVMSTPNRSLVSYQSHWSARRPFPDDSFRSVDYSNPLDLQGMPDINSLVSGHFPYHF